MRLIALLVVALAAACGGSDQAGAPTPTATPAPSPTPGCGNGIVDPGEFCDGEDFCSASCLPAIDGGCCEFGASSPEGAFCLDTGVAGAQACLTVGGSFSIGTECTGEPCDNGIAACRLGHCRSSAIEAVTVCCQRSAERCTETTVTDGSALASFILFDCDTGADQTAVVGSCGADGRCAPRR